MKPLKYDVAIIGGGAAGMCAAVSLMQHDRSLNVALIEQLPRVGKKLITTGNGRCNITNLNVDISKYHSDNIDFVSYCLENYDNTVIENFFAELGVVFLYDETGRAYPYSLQASSVVDALRFACDNMGINIFTDTKVISLKKTENTYEIDTTKGLFVSDTVIVASGMYSGGESLGSNGCIFEMLKSMGYKTVKPTPAIVQIKTDNTYTRQLKGIKVNANATLYCDSKAIRSEYGEVLFCDYGLSGPPIMQISRAVERERGDKHITLDLMPDYTYDKLYDLLSYRIYALRGRMLEEFFCGMLNKRLGQIIIKLTGKKLSESVDTLKKSDLKRMASLIKNFDFAVIGSCGFENSQVTAGGIDTKQFDNTTMMSKRDKGLFLAGEILDVDGDCGGYNLRFAWSSSLCAADGVMRYIESL